MAAAVPAGLLAVLVGVAEVGAVGAALVGVASGPAGELPDAVVLAALLPLPGVDEAGADGEPEGADVVDFDFDVEAATGWCGCPRAGPTSSGVRVGAPPGLSRASVTTTAAAAAASPATAYDTRFAVR